MTVKQTDFRTVKIEINGFYLFLRYSIRLNGEERLPESIVAREDSAVAYFLTATIRDSIRENSYGLAVERNWSIMPEGTVALSFCLDFPDFRETGFSFPPAGRGGTDHISGRHTAYHCGLFLYNQAEKNTSHSGLVFIDPPAWGSIETLPIELEDKPFRRVMLHFPSGVENGPDNVLHSAGNFEHSLRLNLVVAPAGQIHRAGVEAGLSRLAPAAYLVPASTAPAPESPVETPAAGTSPETSADPGTGPAPGAAFTGLKAALHELKGSVRVCLDHFLYQDGGICGLRTLPEGTRLSSLAGSGLAFLLSRLFPDEAELLETALRLADFSLRGQHPSGLFYEHFDLRSVTWRDLEDDEPKRESLVSIEEGAGLAGFLLLLAEQLRTRNLPADKYQHAGVRLVEAMFDSRERLTTFDPLYYPDSSGSLGEGPEILELLPALLILVKTTGKDRYRKAISSLAEHFYSRAPALSNPLSSSNAVLITARSAAILAENRIKVKGIEVYLDLLLPWVYLNQVSGQFDPSGGILESNSSGRLVFRGFEYVYTLLKLERSLKKKLSKREDPWIPGLIDRLIGFTRQKALGCAGYDLDNPEAPFGPQDSRRLVREAFYLLKLQEESLIEPG